jgi:hypothetical protein
MSSPDNSPAGRPEIGEPAPFLESLYAAVDARVAAFGPRCDASGRCCRFTEYGHTLFLSEPEAEFLLAGAPAYEKPVSRDGCPFQVDNLCTAREPRPLGCRIYFCDPSYQETAQQIMEDALAELKHFCDVNGLGWRYAPLHHWLNELERPADETPPAPEKNSDPAGRRLPLPLAGNHQETKA